MANDIVKAPSIEESLGYKVVKDNLLIRQARNNLSKVEMKLLNYSISLVKPEDEDFKAYRIKKSDFALLAELDVSHINRGFKKIAEEIKKKYFWFENDEREKYVDWFYLDNLKEKGYIELRLDPVIKEYIIGLKQNFTEYELFNILSLNTKYAITLYEFFKSYQYKGQIEIDVENFKEHIGAQKTTYSKFSELKRRILDTVIDDINIKTDLDISYKCLDSKKKVIKSLQGRKVYYLRFSIKLKEISETFEVYTKMKDRINAMKSDQVPHQISLDTDNETTALYDDTTNQRIN
jgi:plasmid replication initiation protein